MTIFDTLFTSDVETLKRKNKGHRLVEIVQKERLSPRGLQAVDAVGELRVREALDALRSLFQEEYYRHNFDLVLKDELLQRIAASVARCEGDSERYLVEMQEGICDAGDRGLTIAVLGRLKEGKAFEWMICGLAAIGAGNFSDGFAGEKVMLLGRALGHLGDARAVDPLIVALYVAHKQASESSVPELQRRASGVRAILGDVLGQVFQVSPEPESARVPTALYSVLAARGLDKADGMLARYDASNHEKVRREYEIQDESEASLRALWEQRHTTHGSLVLGFRFNAYFKHAHRQMAETTRWI